MQIWSVVGSPQEALPKQLQFATIPSSQDAMKVPPYEAQRLVQVYAVLFV